MQVIIRGRRLPGRRFELHTNVHVALQVRADADGAVPGDAAAARWVTEVEIRDRDGVRDFRGPAVHGRAEERFLYLTWGDVDAGGSFTMFRRAKLMLAEAPDADVVVADVDLTDERGGPRCARLRAPAVTWSVTA